MTTQTKPEFNVKSIVTEVASGSRSLSSVIRALREHISTEEDALKLAVASMEQFTTAEAESNKWDAMLSAATEVKFISAGLLAASGMTDVKIGQQFGVQGDMAAVYRLTGILVLKDLVKDKADAEAEAVVKTVKEINYSYGAYGADVIFSLINRLKTKQKVSTTTLRRIVRDAPDRKTGIARLKELEAPAAESTAEMKLKSMASTADKLSGLARGDAAKSLAYAKTIIGILSELFPEAAMPADEDDDSED